MSVDSGEAGREIRPAGHRSHRAGACGNRAGVPRWGIAGVASYEQRGAPPQDVPARWHAKAGRRAGLDAQPERPLDARGAKQKPSRSERTKHGRPPVGQENLHGVETKTGAHRPEGQTRYRGSGGLFHTNSPSVVEESLSLRGPEGAEAVPFPLPSLRGAKRRSNPVDIDEIPPRGLAGPLAASASAPSLRSGASR
jgi:hypothetical protein